MFKYIKELFRNVVFHSIVGLNENNSRQIISPEVMENELNASTTMRRNNFDRSDPREIPRPLRKKRSFFRNTAEQKCSGVGHGDRRGLQEKIDLCDANGTPEDVAVAGKKKIEEKEETTGEGRKCCQTHAEEMCVCENCTTVETVSECGVCLEPLQARSVRSCPLCANLVCADCAAKLSKCAFCRTCLPNQRNRAIERLLAKLSLPCRNSRNGCKKMLKSEERFRHEANCDHASVTCPIANGACSWQGSPVAMLNHLRQVHALEALADNGIIVEISSFRQKALTRQGEYTIYLSCYSQLFAVKVILFLKRLFLTVSQLGYVGPVTDEIISSRYGVWIKINGGTKEIRGVFPFGRSNRETREIEINTGKLFSKKSGKSVDDTDCVNIEISIKEISPVHS